MSGEISPFLTREAPVCPPDLLDKARQVAAPVVAIAGAGADLPMQAAHQATQAGIMTPLFTGDSDEIRRLAGGLGWDISGFEILPASDEAAAAQAAAEACGQGRADVLMKGQLHTDIFIKSALRRENGLRTGQRLVHIFHISHPTGGRPLLISDAAVNVSPDMDTRLLAVQQAVKMAHTLGTLRPRVAFLSATETPIASVPSSIEARTLCDHAKATISGADFSGPLALDLILSPDAACIKGVTGDPVAGHADVVIVPDIVSGNTLFKALVYLSGGCAAGIVLGAKVPLLLTSRADPPAARLASLALAAIMATNTPRSDPQT